MQITIKISIIKKNLKFLTLKILFVCCLKTLISSIKRLLFFIESSIVLLRVEQISYKLFSMRFSLSKTRLFILDRVFLLFFNFSFSFNMRIFNFTCTYRKKNIDNIAIIFFLVNKIVIKS